MGLNRYWDIWQRRRGSISAAIFFCTQIARFSTIMGQIRD
jgi:hypothetical protein